MDYEFYADVFFLTNFYLDFLAVHIVGEILQQKKKRFRYLFCCALGSFAGCILFLSVSLFQFHTACRHVVRQDTGHGYYLLSGESGHEHIETVQYVAVSGRGYHVHLSK